MIAELEAELFERGEHPTALIALFAFAEEGRHRIRLALDAEPAFAAWVARQAPELQSACKLALDSSAKLETRTPAATTLIVTCDRDRPDASPPQLSLPRAKTFLEQPVRVLLEHDYNDSAFLRAFATKEERDRLDFLLERRWIEWAHCGGISEVKKRVERIAANTPETSRWFAVFDSDALAPGTPDHSSKVAADACRSKGVGFHQTTRRYQESYLPKRSVRDWGLEKKRQRWSKAQSFLQLRDEQRHHFHLKAGFEGDSARLAKLRERDPATAATVERLYEDVPVDVRATLTRGLGSDIGELFRQPGRVTETLLRDDGAWEEMNAVIRSILRLAR